jgi:hypothetical protein
MRSSLKRILEIIYQNIEFLDYLFYASTMDDELLIETVKKFPVLYANDDISYRNADKKEAAWLQVSSETAVPDMLLVAHFVKVTCRQYSGCILFIVLLAKFVRMPYYCTFWLCEHKLQRNYGDRHNISKVSHKFA